MNKSGLQLLVCGVLILVVVQTNTWTALSGILYLWLVHRIAVAAGSLSNAAVFRSTAVGGIAGGLLASTLFSSVLFSTLSAFDSNHSNSFIKTMSWTTLASGVYTVIAALLLAFGVTLVAPYLSRVQKSDQPNAL